MQLMKRLILGLWNDVFTRHCRLIIYNLVHDGAGTIHRTCDSFDGTLCNYNLTVHPLEYQDALVVRRE